MWTNSLRASLPVGVLLGLYLPSLGGCHRGPTSTPGYPTTQERALAVTGAGSALERITSDPVVETHPSISPDGKVLLLETRIAGSTSSGPPKQQTIQAVDPNTRAQRTLFTSTNSLSDHPAWLPDQSAYVYTSDSPGQWSLVRAMTAAPNAAVNVIVSGEVAPAASWPSVSPDGQRVAFSTLVRGVTTTAVIGIDGSRLVLLGEGQTPNFSPDGRSLAFTRRVGDYQHIFLVDPTTGTGLIQLTSGEFHHLTPAWSPDGRFIVFSTNRGWKKFPDGSADRTWNLYILNRDGTNLTQLTDGSSWVQEPNWGKDGWIYFSSDKMGDFDIWRLKPSGPYANLVAAAPAAPATPAAAAPAAAPAPAAATPAPAPAGATPAGAPAGCTKDTDCKGDRICDKGSCVSPVVIQ